MTLFLTIDVSFLDNKDKKTKEDVIDNKLKLALAMHFIKSFVY